MKRMTPALLCMGFVALIVACTPSEESRQSDSDSDTKTPKYETLHKAAEAGDLEDVKLHVELGANVNKRDEEGYAPFQYAVNNGHTEVAEFLIENGAKDSQIRRSNRKSVTSPD